VACARNSRCGVTRGVLSDKSWLGVGREPRQARKPLSALTDMPVGAWKHTSPELSHLTGAAATPRSGIVYSHRCLAYPTHTVTQIRCGASKLTPTLQQPSRKAPPCTRESSTQESAASKRTSRHVSLDGWAGRQSCSDGAAALLGHCGGARWPRQGACSTCGAHHPSKLACCKPGAACL
jgi:hypothetical protein